MTWHGYSNVVDSNGRVRWRWTGALIVLAILSPLAVAQEMAEDARLHGESVVVGDDAASGSPEDSSDQGSSEQGSSEQDDDFADLSLEELMDVQVVVTASRREQKISSVPYAVSVITAADIRASGARSIPDAIRLVPGVDVADIAFGVSAVAPRGFHGFVASQVLVLVDGRQIFDSLFGGTLWGSWPFQLEDIDRIEVIRGPGGVTWGANAVNGVINIITKDPADQLGLTLSSRGGSRGTFKQHIGYGLQEGKLRMRISGEYEASDGFRQGGSILRNLDDDYKAGRLTLHAIYDKDEDNSFTFSAGSSIVDGAYPPTPMSGFGLRRNSGSQASYIMGTWQHRTAENGVYNWTAFVNDFQVSPGLSQVDYRYQQLGFQFSHTLEYGENHTRTWGMDSRLDLLDTGNSDPFLLTKDFVATGIIGLYLQDEWRFAPRWTLNLGGRIDYEFYGGFQPSTRGSLSYEISDTAAIYGAISRAFQMPPASLRFLDLPLINGLSRVTANRGFDATNLMAYEVGYRGRVFGKVDTSLSIFWHQFDELATLSPRPGPPGLLRYQYDNQSGTASLYGVEFDAKYRVSDKLTLIGNYTYQQLNWNVGIPFSDSDYISPPEHKAMVGARYAVNDDARLAGQLYYVDAVQSTNPGNPFASRRIDPYLRLDLNAEVDFWEDQASMTVGVSNLLDAGHYEGGTQFINDAQVPRMFFVELRLRVK